VRNADGGHPAHPGDDGCRSPRSRRADRKDDGTPGVGRGRILLPARSAVCRTVDGAGPCAERACRAWATDSGAAPRLWPPRRDCDPVAETMAAAPRLRSGRRDYGCRAETMAADGSLEPQNAVSIGGGPGGSCRGVEPVSARAAPLAGCSRSGDPDGQEVGTTDHGNGVSVRDVLHHDIPHFVIGSASARVRERGGRPNGLRKPSGHRGCGARVYAESCERFVPGSERLRRGTAWFAPAQSGFASEPLRLRVDSRPAQSRFAPCSKSLRFGSEPPRAQSRFAPCTVSRITYSRVVAVM
jgi:hypothetical protein